VGRECLAVAENPHMLSAESLQRVSGGSSRGSRHNMQMFIAALNLPLNVWRDPSQ
jgi:hypothetical protein